MTVSSVPNERPIRLFGERRTLVALAVIRRHDSCSSDAGTGRATVISLVRLLGFSTLACGCVLGKYREVATSRELAYIEEKGKSCGSHGHRRNHTVAAERNAPSPSLALASKAS